MQRGMASADSGFRAVEHAAVGRRPLATTYRPAPWESLKQQLVPDQRPTTSQRLVTSSYTREPLII